MFLCSFVVAWQRVDPRITIFPAVGVVSAWVTISGYTRTDELSLEGRYGDDNHDIHAVFDAVSGTLTLTRNEGVTSPVDWADVLRNVNYRLSDHLKPCKDYRNVYTRTFNFYVQDRFKRVSNVFSKGLTIETGIQFYFIFMEYDILLTPCLIKHLLCTPAITL